MHAFWKMEDLLTTTFEDLDPPDLTTMCCVCKCTFEVAAKKRWQTSTLRLETLLALLGVEIQYNSILSSKELVRAYSAVSFSMRG